MSNLTKISVCILVWFICISLAHVSLNVGFGKLFNKGEEIKFQVGFLPVT